MGHSEQFRKHAEECRQMAELNLSGENKEVWERMADRWAHFAAMEESLAPSRHAPLKRRHSRFTA